MEIAIEKARNVGLGMVTISNGRHLSMASYHAMLALKHDMIGMCMTRPPQKRRWSPLSEPSPGWARTLLPWQLRRTRKPHSFLMPPRLSLPPINWIWPAVWVSSCHRAGWLMQTGIPIMEKKPILPHQGSIASCHWEEHERNGIPQGLWSGRGRRYSGRHSDRGTVWHCGSTATLQPLRSCL